MEPSYELTSRSDEDERKAILDPLIEYNKHIDQLADHELTQYTTDI